MSEIYIPARNDIVLLDFEPTKGNVVNIPSVARGTDTKIIFKNLYIFKN